jgi:hypothetical protein
LGGALFQRFWTSLADRLDVLLCRDVICEHFFSPLGLAQFRTDMTVALWALWRAYTPLPQNQFPRVRDGLAILALSATTDGIARIKQLRHLLKTQLQNPVPLYPLPSFVSRFLCPHLLLSFCSTA